MPESQLVQSAAEIGDVPAGTRQTFRVPVARRASGEDLTIAAHVARGAQSGPCLALVGTIHGDAIYGAQIIRAVLERTPLDRLRGSIIAVPVANPIAFESYTRTTGQGQNTDMNNMNRVFPGDRGGWLTQKMAAVVTSIVGDRCDVLIDYHCSGDTLIDYTLVNGEDTDQDQRNADISALFGTRFLFVHKANPFGGTLTDYVKRQGKLGIIAETGGAIVPPGYLDLQVTRTQNVMKAVGMLEGTPEVPADQWLMRTRTLPRCGNGGLYIPTLGVDAVASITAGGTTFGRIIDPHVFEDLDELTVPYSRSVLLMMRTAMGRVGPGDYAGIVADYDSGAPMPKPASLKVEV